VTGVAVAGGVSASGVAGVWTAWAVAGTGAGVAEEVGWSGDGAHGESGRRKGGTVVRT